MKKWSRSVNACVGCGTTTVKHMAKGLCRNCYARAKKDGGSGATPAEPDSKGVPALGGGPVAPTPPNINPEGIEVTVTITLPADSLERIEAEAADKVADEIIRRMKGIS